MKSDHVPVWIMLDHESITERDSDASAIPPGTTEMRLIGKEYHCLQELILVQTPFYWRRPEALALIG